MTNFQNHFNDTINNIDSFKTKIKQTMQDVFQDLNERGEKERKVPYFSAYKTHFFS